MRYPIHIDPWWQPLVLAGAALPANSYVDLTDRTITFRFGLLFHRTFPRGDVASARLRNWPLWYGIGWRANLRGAVGLVGSYQGVVEIRFKNRSRVWGAVPCDRIAVSLENPDAFLAAIKKGAPQQQAPSRPSSGRGRGRPRRSTRKPHT